MRRGFLLCFRLAREMAVAALDGEMALRVVDAMAERYRLDVLEARNDVLKESVKKAEDLARQALSPADHASLSERILDVVDAAAGEETYDLPAHLSELALAEASRARDKEVLAEARTRLDRVRYAAKAFPDYQAAKAVLAGSPHDPGANQTVGAYLCFAKGDWKNGLAYLAEGSDANLKALAGQEGSSPPATAAEQFKFAEAWRKRGLTTKEKTERDAILFHAGEWYERARPGLTGAAKATVEKRLKEAARITPQQPAAGATPRSAPAKEDAFVKLMADSAVLRGTQIHLEPGANGEKHIAGWNNPIESVSWRGVKLPKAGDYKVAVRAAAVNGGSQLLVAVVGVVGPCVYSVIPSTGGYENFQTITLLGTIKIERPGEYQVIACPFQPSANTWKPVNLAGLTLEIVRNNSPLAHDNRKPPASAAAGRWPMQSVPRGKAPPPAEAPFNEAQAKGYQKLWAKYLKVKSVEQTNSIGMTLALIPPGSFMMGQGTVAPNGPAHKVNITRPFWMGKFEVTQEQWQVVMGYNRSLVQGAAEPRRGH